MKLAISLFFFLVIGFSAHAKTSLERPISVVLSEAEVIEYESMLRNGDFSSKDFRSVLVFDGRLVAARNTGDGEKVYRFKMNRVLRSVARGAGRSGARVAIVAPAETKNGGVDLVIGKTYRISAPLLPDGRYGVWRGIVIELNGR